MSESPSPIDNQAEQTIDEITSELEGDEYDEADIRAALEYERSRGDDARSTLVTELESLAEAKAAPEGGDVEETQSEEETPESSVEGSDDGGGADDSDESQDEVEDERDGEDGDDSTDHPVRARQPKAMTGIHANVPDSDEAPEIVIRPQTDHVAGENYEKLGQTYVVENDESIRTAIEAGRAVYYGTPDGSEGAA